ncbi:MAG TPA: hypothetical protein VF735_16380 [Pyrinomonadaceae bacterium]|jgi:hypothetical protein
MRIPRTSCLFLLLSFIFQLGIPVRLCAQQGGELLTAAPARPHAAYGAAASSAKGFPSPSSGGIREVIPDKYRERYEQWKSEFLYSETGQRQWKAYEQNAAFTLTITVNCDDRNGAGTGQYTWNEKGELIAATINLGCRIDEGYPNPIYFPVMNSLTPRDASFAVDKNVLAAAKIAHEFGHIKQVFSADGPRYQLQNQLMPVYNKILLSNGRNTLDPRLVELAQRMGGTPVEIWEDREYWGEANAMLYLRDRITKESDQRVLFTRIRRAVELYAKNYVERFDQIALSRQ